jgi:hypothetical protein
VKLVASVALAVALLVAPSAASAPERDALIRPGIGIGKVSLGMTQPQLRRAMGRAHDTGFSEQRPFGRRFLELVWDGGPDDYFAVGLLGAPRSLRVVSISTTQPRERTPGGFGPGSSRAQLLQRVRGLRCASVFRRDGSGHLVRSELVLRAANGAETVFVPGLWGGNSPLGGRNPGSKRIAYVVVRRPGTEPELEFQSTPCRV